MGRAWRHCSEKLECTKEASFLCQRLIDVSNNPTNLTKTFKEADSKLQKQLKLEKASTTKNTTQEILNHQRLFLHPTYYPRDVHRKKARNLQLNTCTKAAITSRHEKIDYHISTPKEH